MLSKAFFAKQWTDWELDGLVQRHVSSTSPVIIPIWLDVSSQEVRKRSPSLANIVAIRSSLGVDAVAQQLHQIIVPAAEPLSAIPPTIAEGESGDGTEKRQANLTALATALKVAARVVGGEQVELLRLLVFKRTENYLEAVGRASLPIPLDGSLVGRAYLTQQTMIVSHSGVVSDRYWKPVGGRHEPPRSFCAIPLMDELKVPFGVLVLEAAAKDFFDSRRVELSMSTAFFIGPFVHSVLNHK